MLVLRLPGPVRGKGETVPATTSDDASPPLSDPVEARWPRPTYWARATVAVTAVVVTALALWVVKSLIVLVLISMVLAIGLQRPMAYMERHRVPRPAALAILVVGAFATLGGFLALVVPPVARELMSIADRGPNLVDDLQRQPWMRRLDDTFGIGDQLDDLASSLPARALDLGSGLLDATVGLLTVTVLTVSLAIDLPDLRSAAAGLIRPNDRVRFDAVADRVIERIGGYVTGNLVISVIAGTTAAIALTVLGVPYAAALAFWVAISDLIPTIGAILGAAAAIAVAATVGWGPALATAVFFLVYQAAENYVIGPRVMRGAVEMSTAAVLVSVLAGGQLLGLSGVFIALPLAAALHTIVDELVIVERHRTIAALERRRRRPWPLRRDRLRPSATVADPRQDHPDHDHQDGGDA